MRRLNRRPSGGNLLKYSDKSMASARARHNRILEALNNSVSSHNNKEPNTSNSLAPISEQNQSSQECSKRKKFFNSSTEFLHVINTMLMSFCRQITNRDLIRKRLTFYLMVLIVGSLINDYAPNMIFFYKVSKTNPLNRIFMEYGWFWTMAILIPMVALCNLTLSLLDLIDFQNIEDLFERFHRLRSEWLKQRRYSQLKTQLQSSNPMLNLVEDNMADDGQEPNSSRKLSVRFSLEWLWAMFCKMVRSVLIKDMLRLLVCTLLFFGSISLFSKIESITRTKQSASSRELATLSDSNSKQASYRHGFDISGHTFLATFALLVLIEECQIMTSWESLGDRLYSLSAEYEYIQDTATRTPELLSLVDSKRNFETMLFTWNQFESTAWFIRGFFFLAAIKSIFFDLMFIQTIFFYHTIIEKLPALLIAYACWFIAYRILFPLLKIEVRKINCNN